jgi:uncharacterized protein
MIIVIKDIREGINEFEHEVLAENYGLEGIGSFSGPIRLKIFIDKLGNLFRFKISVAAMVEQPCDRCLELYRSEISDGIEQIYQLGSNDLDSDEIEILAENCKEIDITKAIHDVFMLNRPMQGLCRDDCRGLCPNCGTNLNIKSCDCHRLDVDPRFEKLKSLLK